MLGLGTYRRPYVILNQSDLHNIRNKPNANFVLGCDIELTGVWEPIPSFYGVLDGNGFDIKNLEVNYMAGHAGLISVMQQGSSVKDLRIFTTAQGVNGSSSYYQGVLVGVVNGGAVEISKVVASGFLNPGGSRGGGLIGYTEYSPSQQYSECICSVVITNVGDFTNAIHGNGGPSVSPRAMYFNSNVSRTASSGIAGSVDISDLSNKSLYTLLDFENTWEIRNSLPALKKPREIWEGSSYLSGSFPDGITTLDGVPISATVRVLLRGPNESPYSGMLVAEIVSNPDGTWRVDGISSEFSYDVIGRLPGEKDVIVSNVTPVN